MARSEPKPWRKYYERRKSRQASSDIDFNDETQFSAFDRSEDERQLAKMKDILDRYPDDTISKDLYDYFKERVDEVEETKNLLRSAKGKERSIDDAKDTVNPNYKSRKYEYTHNCQRCVIAYEMQRRGYDVEAMPTDGWGGGSHSYLWRTALSGNKMENLGAKRRSQVLPKINEKMEKWGVGSRAIIQVEWDTQNSAHVFNAEMTSSGLRLIEAQSGENVNFDWYNLNAKPSSVSIMRTDTSKITPDIRYMVKKRGS